MSLEALPTQRLAQLQAIYDGAPVGLCFLDRNLRYVSLNRRLANMNRVPAAAHMGQTPAEIVPLVFRQVEPFLRRALSGDPISGVEIHKPGIAEGDRGQTLLCSYQPVRDEGGDVLGVSVAVMDISESKRVEDALRESEDHYRHMFKLNPHLPWVLDTKGEVTEASPRWEDVTGQPVEQALGNGWQQMLHRDDVGPTVEAIRISLGTGEPIDVNYRVRRPDGEWIWMRSRGTPRFGPSGKIVCIYGVTEEIHGHRLATEELNSCLAELRAALDAVPTGLVLADGEDGTIFMVNPAARSILCDAIFPGQKLREYSRLSVARADGSVVQPEEYPLVRAILRGETSYLHRVFYERADGTQIRISLSGKPIYADDGQLIGGVMVVRDLDTFD